MKKEVENKQIELRTLRNAGVSVGIAFVLISIWPYFVHGLPMRYWAAIVSGVLFLFSLIAPQFIYWPYCLWMKIGAALGWLNTRVILSLLFFLILTPTGIVRRIFSSDSIGSQIDRSKDTYKESYIEEEVSKAEEQF
jgi:uncharacterized membrane protein YhiD involved in acid resistance